MKVQGDIDFTTLNWVKQELDETLKQARQALEVFVEDPVDTSQMRFCATYLHQVQGTLRMVELYGAALVVEEMERVALGLLDGEIKPSDDAYAVLMRGIVQLPDYLERLQSGHRDIPVVLLPLLNDLRATRGEKLLSENVLFSPDLSINLPTSASGPNEALPGEKLKAAAARLRLAFQFGLLRWFKDEDAEEILTRLVAIADRLRSVTKEQEARRLWWVAGAVLDGLLVRGLEPSVSLKLLFGRVDREIKRLADEGEESFRQSPPHDLTKSLLYYAAHAETDSRRISELKELYRLDELLPDASELEHARGSLSGHNRELLNTVSNAIKEDLLRVKDALDLHLRNEGAAPGDLEPLTDGLHRVADTLGMLGLGVPRKVVQEQMDLVGEIARGERPGDEGTLLDVAGALLYVESSLDDHIEQLGGPLPEPDAAAGAAETEDVAMELPQSEVRRILQALMREAATNLQQTKQDIIAFIEAPWDHDRVAETPRLLQEIVGALRMLNMDKPAELLQGVVVFTTQELLEKRKVPSAEQLDTLADAVASIEYYLEAVRDQRSGRDRILDVTRESLEKLGYLDFADGSQPTAANDDEAPAVEELTSEAASVGEPTPAASDEVAAAAADEPSTAELELELEPLDGEDDAAASADDAAEEITLETEAEDSAEPDVEDPDVEDPEALGLELLDELDLGDTEDDADDLALDAPGSTDEAEPEGAEELTLDVDFDTSLTDEIPDYDDGLELVADDAATDDTDDAEPRLEGVDDLELGDELSLDLELEDDADDDGDAEGVTIADGDNIEDLIVGESSAEAVEPRSEDADGQITVGDLDPEAEEIELASDDLQLGGPDLADDAARDEFDAALADAGGDEPEPEPEPEVAREPLIPPVHHPEPTSAGFEPLGDDIDDEIREVFVEEVEEELENLATNWPKWRANTDDEETLTTIRRTFHTLKGSGRLVGALTIGEFAWKVENMLNRVIDRTIEPGPPVMAVMQHAIDALPQLLGALQDGTTPTANIEGIKDVAHRLSEGEEAWLPETDDAAKAAGDAGDTDIPMDQELLDGLDAHVEAAREEVGGMDHMDLAADQDAAPTAEEEAMEAVAEEDLAADDDGVDAVDEMPSVDPVLLEILEAELSNHLATVRDYLSRAPQLPPVDDQLVRVIHTLNGAISMAEVAPAVALTGPLEGYYKRLAWHRQPPSDSGAEVTMDICDYLDAAIAALKGDRDWPQIGELERRLIDERDALGEPPSDVEVFGLEASIDEEDGETIELESEALAGDVEEIELEAVSVTEEIEDEASEEIELASDDIEELELATDEDDAETIELATDAAAAADADDDPFAEADDTDDERAALDADDPFADPADDADDRATVDEAFDESDLEPIAADAEDSDAADAGEEAAASIEESAELDDVFEAEADRAEASEVDPDDPFADSFEDLDIQTAVVEIADDEAADGDADDDTDAAAEASEVEAESGDAEEAEDADDEMAEAAEAPPEMVEGGATGAAVDDFEETAAAESEPEAEPEPETEAAAPAPVVEEPAHGAAVFKLADADIDEELLGIFLEEGNEILDHTDNMMASWRETPDNRDLVTELQRELHTLKGGARMAGLTPIGDLSHAMESLFEAVAEDRVTVNRTAIEILESSFDRLHAMLEGVSDAKDITVPTAIVMQLDGLLSGKAAKTPAEFDVAPDPKRFTPVTVQRATALDEQQQKGGMGRQAEVIRVRSDLLDNLVNFAGEVSIYRSRLEQQIGSFRFNLVEFEQTVDRLREQLRKLEMETEAQILSRFQREAEEHDVEFDPLELDRFSQLQQLSRALAESVSDLVSIQNMMDDLTRQSETLLLQQSRVNSELQEGLMRTRMVPFESLVPRLRRILRQTAAELGRKATLRVLGAHGEMDRNVLERITAPLEHMLRNAVAHGLESPEERVAASKSEEGEITIDVSREATEVVLRVSDDGSGINRDVVRKTAIERGLLKDDVEIGDRDLYRFILETGFSTAEEVTKVSGRGVGMDVVNNEIKQLGGTIDIESRAGFGTTFTIRLPFTLAVTHSIMVRVGEHQFAIPLSSIEGVVRMSRKEFEQRVEQGNMEYAYAGETFTIHELNVLLGMGTDIATDDDRIPLLIARLGDQRAAVRVDAVQGNREVVVKSVSPQISSIPGIFGATILGDGSVIVILDLGPLVRRGTALHLSTTADIEAAAEEHEEVPELLPERQPLVMVVDDSITMRKVTTRVLERHDMEVVTAKDGVDAVQQLQERIPDVMLLDIEMPRMDGYELATHMRNDSRMKDIPIIMITSRTGEKHRQRAMEIGVDRYLGKPYQEADLLKNVNELLDGEQ